MVTCFIGVGSNLGDRLYYINTAIKKIKCLASTKVVKASKLIETAPYKPSLPQGPYLNGVVQIQTDLTPYQLLQELQKIENYLGRVRTVKNAPRTLDLDILTYGDACFNEDALCIPHPHILERDFVFKPLAEIAPEVLAGLRKKTVKYKNKVKPKRKCVVKKTLNKAKRKKKK